MKILLKNILDNRGLRIRIIGFFLLLIYLPIILNIYLVYSRTLNIVKEEKIQAAKEVLKKTKETLELNISDITREVSSFSNNLGTGASIAKYHTLAPKYQENIDKFFISRVNSIAKDNYYIDDIYCITRDNRMYSTNNILKIDSSKFFNSKIYKEFSLSKEEIVWLNIELSTFTNEKKGDRGIFIIEKIHHISPDNLKDKKEGLNVDLNIENVVGYTIAYIDKRKLGELYSKITLAEGNEIAIYDKLFNPIISKPSITLPSYLIERNKEYNKDIILEEFDVKGKEYALGLSDISPLNWHIVSIAPVEGLIGSIKKELNSSLWLLGLIGIIVSIVIIIEILVFSRGIAEKEMVNYRLKLSEDVNEKLRMYKHDFMNHLQIIQGLLEMKCPDRAVSYLKGIVKEGRTINRSYKIGVPEIEATISTLIDEAKENNIEVIVDAVEITRQLPINLYDLIRVLTNLIKNAMYALVESEDENKLLKINIDYVLGNYIFKITNNTPIIPEDIQNNIFKKGFTTKGDKGSGLGLSIVKKIVSKYNGSVNLVVDEYGNHFIVKIPD